jgi:2-keto-3-deoxy-L-fuconate dehydrogenase
VKLAGRSAVVTGAGSGIGRAIAELFHREGARIAAVDRDAEALRELERALGGAPGTLQAFTADVADADAAAGTVTAVEAAWGSVDILVTCAAISLGGTVPATRPEAWEEVFRVNVRGTYLWLRAVIPRMVAQRRGSIVTVGSQLALAGGRGNASYVASKGAVIALTRAVAVDHATDGIRANVLIPGAIETPMLERSFGRQPDPAAARTVSQRRHPLGRFGTPREVALAALYLASDDASFVTGSLLAVDGGWLAG